MSIADLGSLGEFVGSFVVLLTLAYLAVQTRATRQATDLQTFLALNSNGASFMAGLVGSDPHALTTWTQGQRGERLEGEQLDQFGHMLSTMTLVPFASILHATPSPTRARALEGYEALIQETWTNPNFVELWERGFWSYLIEDQRKAIESYRN